MDKYTFWKLFEINYNIQIHSWNANERFCSQVNKIYTQLFIDKIFLSDKSKKSKEYKLFLQMFNDIELTIKLSEWRTPLRLKNRLNSTAIKYIKLLKWLELNFI